MCNKQKVSIIVPVYNVEEYFEECIQSIISQTYTNIEIILVDDGSTDGSGRMCDEYAKQDPRIVVVHKENGGLSSARNAGLDVATGEYIQFIDSDDYIAPIMTEDLMQAVIVNQAHMAIGGVATFYYENGARIERYHNMQTNQSVVSGKDILCNISSESHFMYDLPTVIVCNKLFHKQLFENIRFPIGQISEDNYVIHRLYVPQSTIAIVNKPHYYYRQRFGSIIHDESKRIKNQIDTTLAIADRARYYYEKGLHKESLHFYHMALFGYVNSYYVYKQTKREKSGFKKLKKMYKELLQGYNKRKDGLKKYKIELSVFAFSPFLHRITFKSYRKLKGILGDKNK